MKLHKREKLTLKAEQDLSNAMTEWMESHGNLTFAEMINIISGEFSRTIGHLTKYEIRFERHGDHNKRGGLAYDSDSGEDSS